MLQRTSPWVTACIAALLVGCTTQTVPDLGKLLDRQPESEKRPHGRKKLDVFARSLGNSQEISLEPAALAARVSQLQDEKKPVLARGWILRHPDATLDMLRTLDADSPAEMMRLIAEVHDEQTIKNGNAGWSEVFRTRKTNPNIETYCDARTLFHQRMAEGLIDRALEVDLIADADATACAVLSVDARQLRGTAFLLADRPAQAVAAFDDAIRLAEEFCPYQAAYLLMLQSDAQRRAGDGKIAADTWQQAVVTAAYLLDDAPALVDPVLWERLSYLRPASRTWPADVVALLEARDSLAGFDDLLADETAASDKAADPADAETIVWHSIGRWYLDRSHAQAALVAFKRAESAAKDDATRQWLRFRQAKAMVVLGQGGAATAILVGLAASKSSAVDRPVSAMLGTLYLQRGQLQRGLTMLRKAVERDDGVEWAERSEAEADLGLAYLSIGDERKGLERLHLAQERFQAENEPESLVASLENELKYLEQAGKRREASDVRAQLRAAEKGE
jgi:tetratricopeptide (TPR) repeat protein